MKNTTPIFYYFVKIWKHPAQIFSARFARRFRLISIKYCKNTSKHLQILDALRAPIVCLIFVKDCENTSFFYRGAIVSKGRASSKRGGGRDNASLELEITPTLGNLALRQILNYEGVVISVLGAGVEIWEFLRITMHRPQKSPRRASRVEVFNPGNTFCILHILIFGFYVHVPFSHLYTRVRCNPPPSNPLVKRKTCDLAISL